jgi:DUF4097 and DUF4098 domain-containing protein YvlB
MRARTPILWAACVLGGAALTAAATVDRTYTRSYTATSAMVLEVHSGDGDVDLRPSVDDRIDIVVRYHATTHGLGGPRDFEVDFAQNGDVVRVEGREIGSGFVFGGVRIDEYDYTIQAPPWVALRLRADDGDIALQGWAADVDIESSDGEVAIDGLRGDLKVTLDDGDVDLTECAVGRATVRMEDGDLHVAGGSGEWDVSLDDGDVDARDLAADRLRVRAEDGDIDVGLALAATLAVDLQTDDGNVDVSLPPGAEPDFLITVDDGSVRLALEGATVESRDAHVSRGHVGAGGGGTIRIATRDGNVTLRDAP